MSDQWDWKAQHDLCCQGQSQVIDAFEREREQWRDFHAAVGLLLDAIPAELVERPGFVLAFAPVLGKWTVCQVALDRVDEQGGPFVLATPPQPA